MAIINIKLLPIEEAKRDYPALWNTAKTVLPRLTQIELAAVVALVVGTCSHCHEDDSDCQCWNDE